MTIDTQLQAYAAIKPTKVQITQQAILAHLLSQIEYGATSDELAKATNIPYETIQPRTNEMLKAGKTFHKGTRRSKRSGALTDVWFIAITDEEVKLGKKQYRLRKHATGDKKLWNRLLQKMYAYKADPSDDSNGSYIDALITWGDDYLHNQISD